jgi:tetratricopeptide (TPR) repeat protein
VPRYLLFFWQKLKEQIAMKKVLVTFVLALTGVSLAQGNPQPQATTPSAQPATTPANQKVIKDPAEYNAYITALNTQDPGQRAAAMEAFVKQYPQSVVMTDALEQAMAAYQQKGDAAQVEATAKRILQLMPNNIRALAIVVALDRAKATGGDQAALKEMCTSSQTGVQQIPGWQKPEGMNDADFQKLRNQMSDIFSGAAGFCALQNKDFAGARTNYQKAFEIDPTNLQDVYQLSVADLELNPIDLNGFWYCGKAISLAQRLNNPQAVNGMAAYCKSKYKRFHGTEEGWDQVAAAAATQSAPGPEIAAIKAAPTPAELACKAVQDNDPSTLSFGDWEYILQFRDSGAPCNKEAADKVWQAIQNKQKSDSGEPAKLQIPILVVASTADSVEGAITDDNQQAKKADIHIVLAKAATKPPAPGSTVKIIGNITDYTPSPFMFTMTGGELPQAPKPPVRKGAVRKTTKKG